MMAYIDAFFVLRDNPGESGGMVSANTLQPRLRWSPLPQEIW